MTTTPDGLSPVPPLPPFPDDRYAGHPLRPQIGQILDKIRACQGHLEGLDDETDDVTWWVEWGRLGALHYALFRVQLVRDAEAAIAAVEEQRAAAAGGERAGRQSRAHHGAWVEGLDEVLDVLRGGS